MSIGTLCVLLPTIVRFLNALGQWVVGLNDGWSTKVARKPPDPETGSTIRLKRRKRLRRLSTAAALIMTIPMILNPANAKTVACMARKICTGNWTPKESSTLHDLLRATNNQALIASISGMYAIVDSGCTAISTFDKSDFLPGTFVPSDGKKSIGGIGGALPILGTGEVKYEVLDDFGRIKYLQGRCHLVEGLPVRLIPPQCIMETRDDGFYSINGEDGGQFVFKVDGGVVATPIVPACNLPMVTMFRNASKASEDLELSLYSCVTKENNQNLSPTQKGLLRWHARLGHPGMVLVRWLAKRGLLGSWGSQLALSRSDDPKCATCQYGKQVCRSTGSTHTTQRPKTVGGIQHDRLNPEDQVAVDQFEVTKPGRKFNTSGCEKDTEKFTGGIIFVDVATGLTKIYFHISTGASDAIASKQNFERFAYSCGVVIRSYRTDNGIFTKEEFLTEIIDNYQTISCSGVGAHHQNGIAERAIRTHVTKARTILLHAMLRWPEQTSSDLWPMAMQHSEHLVNVIPTMSDGFSPEEKFCRTFKSTPQLQHLPVWGCPTYVLDLSQSRSGT